MKKYLHTFIIILIITTASDLKAQFNQNLAFKDSNLVVDCGSMPAVFENVSAYTVEVRVKFKEFGWWGNILCKRTYFERDVVMQCYDTTGQIGIAVSNAGYGFTYNSITKNEWHHLAMVYDGNNATNGTRLKFYIDGVQQTLFFLGVIPPLTPVVSGSRFCLGAEYNDSTAVDSLSQLIVPFNGSMDELRIWNTARTENEIIANMNSELSLPQNNLVAYYQFNQGRPCDENPSDSILADATGNYPGLLWNFKLSGSASNFSSDVDNTVTINGSLITANAIGANYQWYNCDLDTIVNGEITSSYNISDNNYYSVIITQDLCVDTSDCFQSEVISVYEMNPDHIVNVYPNPLRGDQLYFSGIESNFTVTVMNDIGNVESIFELDNTNTVHNIGDLAAGIYFLKMEGEKISLVKRLQVIR